MVRAIRDYYQRTKHKVCEVLHFPPYYIVWRIDTHFTSLFPYCMFSSAYGPTSIWGVKPSFARMVKNKCFVFSPNKCHICPNWGGQLPPPLTPRPVCLFMFCTICFRCCSVHWLRFWCRLVSSLPGESVLRRRYFRGWC